MGKIEVKVITNGKKEEIKNRKLYINETPIRGRANRRLIKLLKERTVYNVNILKGENSNIKLIEFPVDKSVFLNFLKEI